MANDDGTIPFKPKVTPKVTPDPNAAVIELIESYLVSAKEGKIKFVAIAAVDDNGVAFATWEPGANEDPRLITQGLGAVAFLNYRFNAAADEGANLDSKLRGD